MIQSPISHVRAQLDPGVDLLHLKLFHHFTTHTLATLILPPGVWNNSIRLSFEFEFLANIMLCVSARHLAFLHPAEHLTYDAVAAKHLGLCLSGFRQALLGDLETLDIDAFIATSLLLQYDVWTDTNVCQRQSNGMEIYDPLKDRMFTFCSSLKRMFLSFLPRWPGRLEDSVFLMHLRHEPNVSPYTPEPIFNSIKNPVVDSGNIATDQRHVHNLTEISDDHMKHSEVSQHSSVQHEVQGHLSEEGANHEYIVQQVCIFESHLPDGDTRPTDQINPESPLFPDLVRSLFSFPVMCRGKFASLIQDKNPQALAVLWRFYRTVRVLLPQNQGWWAHKRAAVSEEGLLKCLQQIQVG